ncbi:SDR family oxidoreductase [Kitasatospora sp. NPDC048365]|uniref:SDR family oxidoreductase n=1 Tax=Kitasatospora sp. NPDC048365 TaxID=3364050 RepID=UPI00371A4423
MTALVLGANGFIGRWLTLHLLTREDTASPVTAAVRGEDTALRAWLRDHGADDRALTTVRADVSRPDLGLSPADHERLSATTRDIYNLAALYRFGLTRAEAAAVNADGAAHTVRWAAGLPRLRRLVHLSGYRVGSAPSTAYPLPDADERYRAEGAYEASKREGDAAVRVLAPRLGVPVTVVNPAVVIGHSVTGECEQFLGLAPLVEQLYEGRLPALAGSRRTFVPVVAVDHLAAFLAAVPEHDSEPLQLHTVLDPATPPLPELVAEVARHLGVRAPRLTVPLALVRLLPERLTGVDREALSFLSEDRYDTASAERLEAAVGLAHPPVEELLGRWAVRLVADRSAGAEPHRTAARAATTGQ